MQKPRIELTIGPMFAGKTSGAVCLANKLHTECPGSVLFVCNMLDMARIVHGQSAQTTVYTHGKDPASLKCKRQWADTQSLPTLEIDSGIRHVFVDELQFYDAEVVRQTIVNNWAMKRRLNVHAYGLNSDSQQRMWPAVAALLPLAPALHTLSAICEKCKQPATTTIAIAAMPADGSGISVGGADKYEARCVDCCLAEKK